MASRSVNKVILVGRLGKDAETRFTPAGIAMTKFSVATSRRWLDKQTQEWKEETDWSDVTLWRSENLSQYLTKGTQVYVEGRLQTRSYDDKDGKKVYRTDVVADEVILLGGRSDNAGGGDSVGAARTAAPAKARPTAPSAGPADDPFGGGMHISDDDVPF